MQPLTKRGKVIVLCVLGFLVIQLISYLALSSARIPSIALRLTPEHTHFAPGAKFSWVLLHLDKSQDLSPAQKERMLSLFRKAYGSVYTAESDVPEGLIYRDASGKRIGYHGGFSYTFRILSRTPLSLRVLHSDWEGNLAASSGTHLYLWLLGFWVNIYDGPMVVS